MKTMKIIVLISIAILGLNGCKQQTNKSQAKEITEQDFATFAVRCINALENKYRRGDSFNLVENVEQLCEELGMKKLSDKELQLGMGKLTASDECSGYDYTGKDSLTITIGIVYAPRPDREVLGFVGINIWNPLRYGYIVPNKYKNAFRKELVEQGLYSEAFGHYRFPQGVAMEEEDYTDGYEVTFLLRNN